MGVPLEGLAGVHVLLAFLAGSWVVKGSRDRVFRGYCGIRAV